LTPLDDNTVSLKALEASPEAGAPGTSTPDGVVRVLPLLPLRNTVLFPHLFVPLSVGRPNSLAAIEAVLATEEKTFIVASQRDNDSEQPAFADLYPVGTRAVIKKMARNEQGVIEMIVQGVERVRLLGVEQVEPYLKVQYRPYPLPEDGGPELEALAARHHRPGGQGAGAGPGADAGAGAAIAGPHARPAALRLPARVHAEPGRGQGASPAGGVHAPSGADTAARLFEPRGAGAATAAEDLHLGRDGDVQAAARVHAAAADAGHPAGTGREEPGEGRGGRPAPPAWRRPTCLPRRARRRSAN